jgi:uncharacterized protein (DUF486 family)
MHTILPLVCLTISNLFMTYAWYGHLRDMATKPLWAVIIFSWGIAFFEYCFQVPGNRLGSAFYTLPQLKIIQEVITLAVFALFATFYMGVKPSWNYFWAGACMVGAVFFIFRGGMVK